MVLHAVVGPDNLVHVTGLLPIDKTSTVPKIIQGGLEEQFDQVMMYLKAILETAGSSLDNIVKTRLNLKNLNDSKLLNEYYKKYFNAPYPARFYIQCNEIAVGSLLQLEAVAVVGTIKKSIIETDVN
ncbi:rutC family protein UK114-like isoform X2 [Daktulosphaira vitifoliae]|uniref:rutC family protein UK114-like isoform X2 n=1 Tax=Daktulosphaira vitifoliae TaxID=58002 RepID=UPI0021A99741|nr:rutC family protein UK114-like isoform X2 [Daktulosphaira vitifoliae]